MASNNPGFTPPFGFVSSTSVDSLAQPPLDFEEMFSPTNGLVPVCNDIELHASGRGICTCGIGS
jgi:hypothetical protein